MKKLIVMTLSIVALGMSGTAVANSTQSTDPNRPNAETTAGGSLTFETVNDIAVPTEVLIYVQTNYQGHAVTQAGKTTRDGKSVYSLRVDPNDVSTDYDGFYLLYDTNWKLLGEEKMAPPPPPQPKSKPQQPRQPKPDDNKDEDSRRERPVRPRDDDD